MTYDKNNTNHPLTPDQTAVATKPIKDAQLALAAILQIISKERIDPDPVGISLLHVFDSAGHDGFGSQPGKIAWINSSGDLLNPPPEDENADCLTVKRIGKKVAGRLLGGRLYDEFPV
jgi:hypothetical protein